MYIFGGVDKSQVQKKKKINFFAKNLKFFFFQERFGDLHEYSFLLETWKRIIVSGEGPTARSFHKSTVFEGYMYILGGFDGLRKNDMFRINLDLV